MRDALVIDYQKQNKSIFFRKQDDFTSELASSLNALNL